MNQREYTIRTMTQPEVAMAIDWAAAEGWNPGLADAHCFFNADPSGFLVGMLGEEPIATISLVKYGERFAFLGLYIVKPEYRGQGYGMGLWQAGLAAVVGRTVGLDGVVAQQENYRRSGFALAYRNIRYQGKGSGRRVTDPAIVPAAAIPFAEISAYDQPFFPDVRSLFLQGWLSQPQGTALAIRDHHVLAGYGVIRPCRSGYKIGPLFADSPELAARLFFALQGEAPAGAPLFLDTPAVNGAAVALATGQGMTVVFETARMYLGPAPDLPIDRLFGVTTFELG
jgi:GNAT superfamily N-acetyltransferase